MIINNLNLGQDYNNLSVVDLTTNKKSDNSAEAEFILWLIIGIISVLIVILIVLILISAKR